MYSAIIVDDEKWVIKSLKATLKGLEDVDFTAEFYDGLSAYAYLRDSRPDLAFVDVRLPGMGGLELLRRAKEEKLPTLFIVISGYADFAYAQSAMLYNALGYCVKPFSREELTRVVDKARGILEQRGTPPEKPVNAAPTRNKAVNTMLAYLDKHYMEDISMQTLAELCHMNLNYAGQLFRQTMNQTLNSYLTELRIRHAIDLLTTTDLPVAQVAAMVGYHDYFYFARVFKKTTQTTPSSYRHEEEPAQ
ncbi:MAG: response regulator [Aristaeellaceae bacterium]